MAVDVAGDENIRDLTNDEAVFGLRGKWCFPTPLRGKVASAQHFPHRFNGVSVGDGSQASNEVVNGFPMVGQQADSMEGEVARISNERGGVVVLLDVLLKGGLRFCWSNCICLLYTSPSPRD